MKDIIRQKSSNQKRTENNQSQIVNSSAKIKVFDKSVININKIISFNQSSLENTNSKGIKIKQDFSKTLNIPKTNIIFNQNSKDHDKEPSLNFTQMF